MVISITCCNINDPLTCAYVLKHFAKFAKTSILDRQTIRAIQTVPALPTSATVEQLAEIVTASKEVKDAVKFKILQDVNHQCQNQE